MRRAFGLPQALMIILFISGIVLVSMKFARVNVKHYADNYLLEQARLFSQSSMERALLEISGHERNATNNCWSGDVFEDENGMFDANVTVLRYYLYQNSDEVNNNYCNNVEVTSMETPESHGMVLLRVNVTADKTNARFQRDINLTTTSLQRP